MDIRTKLILALILVAAFSMGVFGFIIDRRVEGQMRQRTLEGLGELAESKAEALQWIIAGWRDQVRLIAGRQELGSALGDLAPTGSPEGAGRLEDVLGGVLGAHEGLVQLQVHDAGGAVVATAARDSEPSRLAQMASPPTPPASELVYAGVELVRYGPAQVGFYAPLPLGGPPTGSLLVVLDATQLAEMTSHYHGLRETGETLIVGRDHAGVARVLHPTRHAPDSGVGLVLTEEAGGLTSAALEGEEGSSQDVLDYRDEPVWAATRYLADTGWALITKIDEVEELQDPEEFRARLVNLAVVVGAFAILLGFGVGLRLALPVHGLAEVANRIRGGDMRARASVAREDEVGMLARTFNDMADEIENQMELLYQFRKFFDVSIDLMCMAGVDGYFKRTNPAFERELGWSADELLEHTFYHWVHPDDLEKTEHEVAKLAEGIPTISFENRYRCKDGSYKVLRWTSYPDPDTGLLFAVAHVMGPASA